MSDEKTYPVPAEWSARAWVDDAKYKEMYQQSISDPDAFWGEMGKRLDWTTPYTKVKNTSFDPDNVSIKWYEDGRLNVCYNCVDRHLKDRADQVAIIWEGDDPTDDEQITYRQQFCKSGFRGSNSGVDRQRVRVPRPAWQLLQTP